MWFPSWLRNRLHPDSTRRVHARARERASFRPHLEALEDRWVPSTLTVTNNLDSGPGSLRADIAAAKSGDTIDLSQIAGQTVELATGELVINKNLTIQGPSAPSSPVTISSIPVTSWHPLSRVFEVDGALTKVALSNLSLTGGNGVANNAASAGAADGQGGAVWNAGKLTLTNCTLDDNSASAGATSAQGGAVWNGGTLTLAGCTLDNNSAYSPNHSVALGGAIYNAGTLNAGGSTLDDNSAGYGSTEFIYAGEGGAIYNAGKLALDTCTVSGNTALESGSSYGDGYGGGVFNALKASATVTGGTISGNNGQRDGGGIYNDGTLTLIGASLTGNVVNDGPGGGIFNDKKGHLAIQSASSVVNNVGYDLYDLGATTISTDSRVGTTVK